LQPGPFAAAIYPPPPAAPVTPAASAQRWRAMTRRTAFRAVSGVGVLAIAGGIAAIIAMHPGQASAAATSHSHHVSGPVVAYLSNGSTGDVQILYGTTKVTVHDPALAARLANDASSSHASSTPKGSGSKQTSGSKKGSSDSKKGSPDPKKARH
jgi:hypothetical protein